MALTPDGYNEQNKPCGVKIKLLHIIIRFWGKGYEYISKEKSYTRQIKCFNLKEYLNESIQLQGMGRRIRRKEIILAGIVSGLAAATLCGFLFVLIRALVLMK